jgi:hypothetical protein
VRAMPRKQPVVQVSGYALAGRIQGCHDSMLGSREMTHGGNDLPPCRGGLMHCRKSRPAHAGAPLTHAWRKREGPHTRRPFEVLLWQCGLMTAGGRQVLIGNIRASDCTVPRNASGRSRGRERQNVALNGSIGRGCVEISLDQAGGRYSH